MNRRQNSSRLPGSYEGFCRATNVEGGWDFLKRCCGLLNTHSTSVEQQLRILTRTLKWRYIEMLLSLCAASAVAIIMRCQEKSANLGLENGQKIAYVCVGTATRRLANK